VGVVAEPRADRVVHDVFDRVREVVVVADDPGGETIPEEMSASAVSLVETLSVDAVQAVHAVGEARHGRLDDEVVVRAHQTEHVAAPAFALDDVGEQREEGDAVAVVAIDHLVRDTARRHLKEPARW
jgi:hypothetical protein